MTGESSTLYSYLESKTAFDQWIERLVRLRLRVRLVGFYTAMQICAALGMGFFFGYVYPSAAGHAVTAAFAKFLLTLLTLFVIFSWQARKSSIGFWINGTVVALLTTAINIGLDFSSGPMVTHSL